MPILCCSLTQRACFKRACIRVHYRNPLPALPFTSVHMLDTKHRPLQFLPAGPVPCVANSDQPLMQEEYANYDPYDDTATSATSCEELSMDGLKFSHNNQPGFETVRLCSLMLGRGLMLRLQSGCFCYHLNGHPAHNSHSRTRTHVHARYFRSAVPRRSRTLTWAPTTRSRGARKQ